MNGLRRNDADGLAEAGINPMPLVAVVILNWNGKAYLQQFLPFVLASTYSNLRVVVADNASTDDSVSFLQQHFPGVEVISNHSNEGFAKGYNSALKQVSSDYYVLLNNDVEVTPGWIEPVIQLMQQQPRIAACQPKLLDYKNRHQFEYAGASGGWLDHFGYPFARGRVFNEIETDRGQYDTAQPCFWASGAAMFVRANVYHALGGLDEFFFAHQEEIDFCWRLQLAGHEVYVQPQSVVYHVGGGTLSKTNHLKTFLNFRNNLIMLAKNLPLPGAIPIIIFRLALDAVAAWKELFGGSPAFFIAICKSHVFFVKWLVLQRQRSVFPASRNGKLQGWYRSSVVWQHFIKKKKSFSEIIDGK